MQHYIYSLKVGLKVQSAPFQPDSGKNCYTSELTIRSEGDLWKLQSDSELKLI